LLVEVQEEEQLEVIGVPAEVVLVVFQLVQVLL
jgi:hypothetical protein